MTIFLNPKCKSRKNLQLRRYMVNQSERTSGGERLRRAGNLLTGNQADFSRSLFFVRLRLIMEIGVRIDLMEILTPQLGVQLRQL